MVSVRMPWRRAGWDDVRCPRDGEMVNVRCWNCGWVRPTDEDEKAEAMPAKTTWTVPATVVRVVDGDTVVLLLDLGWHISMEARCRLSGINCPELNTPEGQAARGYVVAALNGAWNKVTFVSHSLDKYGRPLGTIILPGGASLNQMLLAEEHAMPMEG